MTNEKQCDGSGQLPGYQLAERNLNPCPGCPKCQSPDPPTEITEALEGLKVQNKTILEAYIEISKDFEDSSDAVDAAKEMSEHFENHLSTVREWVGAQQSFRKRFEFDIAAANAEIARLREEGNSLSGQLSWSNTALRKALEERDTLHTERDTYRKALEEHECCCGQCVICSMKLRDALSPEKKEGARESKISPEEVKALTEKGHKAAEEVRKRLEPMRRNLNMNLRLDSAGKPEGKVCKTCGQNPNWPGFEPCEDCPTYKGEVDQEPCKTHKKPCRGTGVALAVYHMERTETCPGCFDCKGETEGGER